MLATSECIKIVRRTQCVTQGPEISSMRRIGFRKSAVTVTIPKGNSGLEVFLRIRRLEFGAINIRHVEPVFLFVALLLVGVLAFALVSLLAGWSFGYDTLVRLRPNYVAMVPSTALCFLLASLGLLLTMFGDEDATKSGMSVAVWIAVIVLANGALRLTVDPQGIDGLMVSSLSDTDRMSTATIIGFLLVGATIHTSGRRRLSGADGPFVNPLAVLGLSTAAAVLIMHSYQPDTVAHLRILDGLSVYTTLLFAVLFLAHILTGLDGEAGIEN